MFYAAKDKFLHMGSGLGKIITIDQLQRRGIAFANVCYLCVECYRVCVTPYLKLSNNESIVGVIVLYLVP